jgi:hypothetical protein
MDDPKGVVGWIVFQFFINALNSILINFDNLGRTGEVYLTNVKKMMLSQSRLLLSIPTDLATW